MSLSLSESSTYNVSAVPEVDPDVLAEAIDGAEPGALLMALVHLTGDLGLLDEFEAKLDTERRRAADTGEPLPIMGGYPEGVAATVRERAHAVLAAGMRPALGVPGADLLIRMARICTFDAVGEEYAEHLREMAGFAPAKRFVPATKRPQNFSVAVIGAGMVGINAGIVLAEAGFDYHIFEARHEIAGTWSRNVYPGAAVDTPSHFYSYSFELNPHWTKYYPTGAEYYDYLHGVADKYEVWPHISLRTKVLSCAWQEDQQVWLLRVQGPDGTVREHRANAVITACGVLNSAVVPEFPGAETFDGVAMHTAEWRRDVDLRGKRVVVLGTGCTSVQVVANIAEEAGSVDVVLRQPHWVVPEPKVVSDVPEALRWALEYIPYMHQWFRLKSYWWQADKAYAVARIDPEWYATHLSASPANDARMQACLSYMDRMFADRPDLKEKLTPNFPPLSKRIIKDPGFYEAVLRDDVAVHRGSFAEIRPDGVLTTEGEFLPADVIIYATGFKLEYLSFLEVTGRDGVTLAEEWGEGEDPRAHLGVTVPGFPNFFATTGPNSAANHGGGHNQIGEEHVNYARECLQYLVENGLGSLEVRRDVCAAYNARVDEALDITVWRHPRNTTSYYRNKDGRAIVSSPWRLVDYWEMLRTIDPDDYVFTPSNRAGADVA